MLEELDTTRAKMKEQEKRLNQEISSLQNLMNKTVHEKDKRFIDTVDEMNTEHRIEVDTLRNNMVEEREITLSAFEVKAYEEMFQQTKRFQKLNVEYMELEERYNVVKGKYEERIKEMEKQHDMEIMSMQQRKEYQRQLSGENSKREFNNLINKSSLEIRGLKNQQLTEI